MENDKEQENNKHINESPQPIETNYSEHKDNPGPPVEAVVEENKDGAGKMLKFIIPIAVLILMLIWFLFRE